MVDAARYLVALIWTAFTPLIFFWFLIHPLAGFWRRRGPKAAYPAIGLPLVGLVVLIVILRERILTVEFGSMPLLWIPAGAAYALAVYIELRCRKHLKLRTLMGVPELDADQSGRRLLTSGIYGRIRHPRYLDIFLVTIAVALFTNYLAAWILVPVYGLALFAIAILEERELGRAFGEEYARYRERVPRFFPRTGRG